MIYLAATTDTYEIVTDAAATLDIVTEFVEAVKATGAIVNFDRQAASSSSATTTTILSAPGSSNFKTVKQITIRNHDAALSTNVTVRLNANSTIYERHQVTLTPGDCLEYIEGVGFFTLTNVSTAIIDSNGNTSDVTASAADTYLTGGNIGVTGLLQAGTQFVWDLEFSKTAAGTATPIFNVRYGTGGSTSDTARNTFTLLAQTAATDNGWARLVVNVRTVGASGVLTASILYNHKNTTTGLANAAQSQIQTVTSSTFNTTPSGSIIGLSVNPGASGVWTFQTVAVAAHNLLKQR